MCNGKIRHPNHMIDSQAILFLQRFFPKEWVARPIQPDYGIDLDLELFDYEEEQCITLGEHVFLQVKGTENPTYSKACLYGDDIESSALKGPDRIDVINYNLEVSMLNLVERMGSAFPVLLVIVDLMKGTAYYICLNDYIRHVLPYQKPDYKKQGHVTIHIPLENKLTEEILRWYGKRIKICSLIQEILAVKDTCRYIEGEELVQKVRMLLERIYNCDAWNVRRQWGFIEIQYKVMQELLMNDMYDSQGEFFAKCGEKSSEDWKNRTVYLGIDERPVSGLLCAQESSCKRFLDVCSAMLSSFEFDARHIGLPTYFARVLLGEC